METILDAIKDRRSTICTTERNLKRLKKLVEKHEDALKNETLWTFLLTLLYTENDENIKLLFKQLTGKEAKNNIEKVWIEALPYPPRKSEGNTHLDLALGSIQKRNISQKKGNNPNSNGIEYLDEANGQVLFCEMKWESDISTKVANSLTRNQMARVIENLITFQDSKNKQPDEFYFTLVTPKQFKDEKVNYSRLYGYKFEEYSKNLKLFLKDLGDLKYSKLKKRNDENWKYPDEKEISTNIDKLQMNWKSFEEIRKEAPDGQLKSEIMEIFEKGISKINEL